MCASCHQSKAVSELGCWAQCCLDPETTPEHSYNKITCYIHLQVVSEERVEDVGLLDASGWPLPVARVTLGTFSRKDGQPGYRCVNWLSFVRVWITLATPILERVAQKHERFEPRWSMKPQSCTSKIYF